MFRYIAKLEENKTTKLTTRYYIGRGISDLRHRNEITNLPKYFRRKTDLSQLYQCIVLSKILIITNTDQRKRSHMEDMKTPIFQQENFLAMVIFS